MITMHTSKSMRNDALVRPLEGLTHADVALVGGKNASLGELISALGGASDVSVPPGFATTADAYRLFVHENGIGDAIAGHLARDHVDREGLADVGRRIRALFLGAPMPRALEGAIRAGYDALAARLNEAEPAVAVRSSATAEDLPEASFAGQQATFLNVRGADAVVDACRRCFASLFTDRAIVYRERNGFEHMDVALSVGVQSMVRADDAGSGVMFTLDTETGFPDVIVINAAWGLGETVVGGEVDPDEYVVFKPLLDRSDVTPILSKRCGAKAIRAVGSDDPDEPLRRVPVDDAARQRLVLADDEILRLARMGRDIERHYGRPMDIEWAKDAVSGRLFIVQARPETVQSRQRGALVTCSLRERSKELARGLAIGDGIATGRVRVLSDPCDASSFERGDVLVTSITDPDWGPVMERAAAIVTDHGGRTAHAAIVSRELGVPAIVGAGDATRRLRDGQDVTVSCAEGAEGVVYEGTLAYDVTEIDLDDVPTPRTRLMLNIASPDAALRWRRIPCSGIGLARVEFIVMNVIRIHPMALVRFDAVEDAETRRRIEALTSGYADKASYFVDRLAEGVAKIAASRWPDPVIVRTSDFKTNEYARLIGGSAFEPDEENPMLGVRGASRYTRDLYRAGFALECRALKRVRETIGLDNVIVMIPFCRTVREADDVLAAMRDAGLERGVNGLKVYVMAEIPANVILAEQFAERFDGFSIGTNDLTQLVLGIDRDSSELAGMFDERNDAVKAMIRQLIERAHRAGRPVGLCGQAPSDHHEFAEFLVECGIDSISLNPDSVVSVARRLHRIEKEACAV